MTKSSPFRTEGDANEVSAGKSVEEGADGAEKWKTEGHIENEKVRFTAGLFQGGDVRGHLASH